jgi:hypothetical protein
MIEVGVRNQDKVNRWEIHNAQTGPPQPLQDKKPTRKIGIDDHAMPADLHEEAGVANECDAKLAVVCKPGFVSLAASRGNRGVPHQTSELGRALTKGRIAERLLDHPATWALSLTAVKLS